MPRRTLSPPHPQARPVERAQASKLYRPGPGILGTYRAACGVQAAVLRLHEGARERHTPSCRLRRCAAAASASWRVLTETCSTATTRAHAVPPVHCVGRQQSARRRESRENRGAHDHFPTGSCTGEDCPPRVIARTRPLSFARSRRIRPRRRAGPRPAASSAVGAFAPSSSLLSAKADVHNIIATGRSAHPLASSLQRSVSRRVRVVCPASWTHSRRSRCRKPGARRRGKVAPARGRVGGILAARCEGGVTKVVRCWRRARNGRSSMQSKRSLLVSPTTRSSVRNLCSSTSAAAAMAP